MKICLVSQRPMENGWKFFKEKLENGFERTWNHHCKYRINRFDRFNSWRWKHFRNFYFNSSVGSHFIVDRFMAYSDSCNNFCVSLSIDYSYKALIFILKALNLFSDATIFIRLKRPNRSWIFDLLLELQFWSRWNFVKVQVEIWGLSGQIWKVSFKLNTQSSRFFSVFERRMIPRLKLWENWFKSIRKWKLNWKSVRFFMPWL